MRCVDEITRDDSSEGMGYIHSLDLKLKISEKSFFFSFEVIFSERVVNSIMPFIIVVISNNNPPVSDFNMRFRHI